MKTLGRILIILLAAAIVIGGAYALLPSSAGQALVGQPIGSGSENGNRVAPPDFANGQAGHDEHGGSWTTVAQNFLEIAAVVVAVQVVWSIGRGSNEWRRSVIGCNGAAATDRSGRCRQKSRR
jgi:hypothetical protein